MSIVNFANPDYHRVKTKEIEKRDKHLDLAKELKRPLNMKVMAIPIVTDTLGMVTKVLVKGLEELEVVGRAENIKTTALLRSARMPRRVRKTGRDLLSIRLQ